MGIYSINISWAPRTVPGVRIARGEATHLLCQGGLPRFVEGHVLAATPVANHHPAAQRLYRERVWAVREKWRRRRRPWARMPLRIIAAPALLFGLHRRYELRVRHRRPGKRVAVAVARMPGDDSAAGRDVAPTLAALQIGFGRIVVSEIDTPNMLLIPL